MHDIGVTNEDVIVTKPSCSSASSSFCNLDVARPSRNCRDRRVAVGYAHEMSAMLVVLLAAGGGSRFAGRTHKLLHVLADGRTVSAHAIDHAVEAGVGPVLVVTGAVQVPVPSGVHTLHHAGWREGQATSLAAAIDHAGRLDVTHVLLALADQPGIPPEAWRRIATYEETPGDEVIVVASYDGRRGPHPVRLHRSAWPLLPRTGDDGARSLIRDQAHLVHEVACPGSAADIDTLEDVTRWKSS
jgi:molybdenum cofactor cytidylyltransferase